MVQFRHFPLVEVELAHQHIYKNPHGIKPMKSDFLRSTENFPTHEAIADRGRICAEHQLSLIKA